MYLSFYNSDGRIVLVNDYPDDITAPEIAALTPVGGDYYVGRTEPDKQWFDTGVLDERPMLTTEPEYKIAADGVDDVTIPVPSGTMIVCNTVAGPETITAGADFVYTSTKKASDHFVLTPPFPYVPADFWIYSGLVASKTYKSVKTDDVADEAVTPRKRPVDDSTNLARDTEMVDTELATARAEGGSIDLFYSEINPTSDGFGSSANRLVANASAGSTLTAIATLPDIPVQPGAWYDIAAVVGPVVAAITGRGLIAYFYELDSDGDLVYVSDDPVALDFPIALAPYGPIPISGRVKVPAGCVRMAIEGWADAETCLLASLLVKKKLAFVEKTGTSGATGSFGTSETTIETLIIDHGTGIKALSVTAWFKSSVAKDATIRLKSGSDVIATKATATCGVGVYVDISGFLALPQSDTSTITLTYEGAAGSNNVNNRHIEVLALG